LVGLKKILSRLEGIKFTQGNLTKKVKGITFDSRKIENDYIFVAIKGHVFDGHNFINDAISKGATVVIAEQGFPISSDDIAQIIVGNSRKALATAVKAFYKDIDETMRLIGVTGTNGKTTITYLLKNLFETIGEEIGLIGTICNMVGDIKLHSERTTPESLEIFRLFEDMHNANIKNVVMEVSSHGLALERVHGLKFDIGIFTNLTPEHLDFHGNIEEYFKTKKMLFRMSDIGVINVDDKAGMRLFNEIDIGKISYGIKNSCDIQAKNLKLSPNGVSFTVATSPNESEIFHLTTPGIFTVYNALASIATGHILGVELHKMKKALEKPGGVPGRFELIDEGQDFQVIVDYAHSPDGLENILKSVKKFTKGKMIIVFGCGGNRDKMKRPIMGKIAAKLSDYSIITSDNPRFENPELIAKEIEEGIKQAGGKYEKILERKDAIEYAIRQANTDDTIIIAGKGHETFQIVEDRKIPFDDRQVAREMIRRIRR